MIRVVYNEETKAGMFLMSRGFDSQGRLHVAPHRWATEPWYARWVSHRRPFWRRLVSRSTKWRQSVAPVGMAPDNFQPGEEGTMMVSGMIVRRDP